MFYELGPWSKIPYEWGCMYVPIHLKGFYSFLQKQKVHPLCDPVRVFRSS